MMFPKTDDSLNNEILPLEKTPVIPKKPLFRTIKYDVYGQASQVRLRLWKISSCFIHDMVQSKDPSVEELMLLSPEEKIAFARLHRSPTLQKSWKSIRKVKAGGDHPFHLFFSKSWKLQTLRFFFVHHKFPLKNFLKNQVNPKLEHFKMGHWEDDDDDRYTNDVLLKAFRHFINLKSCTLAFSSFSPTEKRIPITLQRMTRLQNLKLENNTVGILSNEDLSRLKRLQRLVLPTIMWGSFQDLLQRVTLIPNLTSLNLHFIGTMNVSEPNFLSFLQNYPRLESLTLFLERVKNYSLEFLDNLNNLKELTFKEIGAKGDNLKKYPRMKGLKKFTIYLRNNQTDLESLRELLLLNKGLKELSLDVPLQEIIEIFKDNLFLPFDTLSMYIPKANIVNDDYAIALAQIFSRHSQLKKIVFKASNDELYRLKDPFTALADLPLLEEMEVLFHPTKNRGNNVDRSRGYMKRLVHLKKLNVDVRQIRHAPINLFGILQAISELPKFETFECKANFDEIKVADYKKIFQLARSIQKERKIKILIFCYIKDSSTELSGYINSKNSLWHIEYEDE